jgi:hypothetical protein
MSPFSCFTLISKPKTNSKTPTVVVFMKPLTNYVAKLFNATVDWHLNLFVFFASDVKWLRSSPGSVTSSSYNMRSVGCQNILISTSVSSSLLFSVRLENILILIPTSISSLHDSPPCSQSIIWRRAQNYNRVI